MLFISPFDYAAMVMRSFNSAVHSNINVAQVFTRAMLQNQKVLMGLASPQSSCGPVLLRSRKPATVRRLAAVKASADKSSTSSDT